MPPRKPSPIGSHVMTSGEQRGLAFADAVGAETVQLFVSNPRGWAAPKPDPDADAAFAAACSARRMPVFVHSPYLVNLASPTELTCRRSVAAIEHAVARGRRLGARGVVVHTGSAVDSSHHDSALKQLREHLLPILDGLDDADPDILLEPTAGGGEPLAATVTELGPMMDVLDGHPRLGICLDTCHAFAAGHDLASPGGVRSMLSALVRSVGRGRLRLVHANDSKDPLGSRRDRHQSIGAGTIGLEPFAELFRHPATSGVPVLVETPGTVADHARDISTLKRLRDR